MRIKKSVLIPSLLLIYLAVMATLGYREFAGGNSSPLEYFGTIAVSLLAIVLLYFNLRYRDRLRRKRDEELSAHRNQGNETDKTNY